MSSATNINKPRRAPHPRPGRPLCLAALLAGLMIVTGCVEVNGGAVELSWSLRTFDGNPIERCAHAKISKIRLFWDPVPQRADDIRRSGSVDFDCVGNRGVTGFEVDEGPHLLYIQPICGDGNPATEHTYEVPPPVLRRALNGQVVALNALLVVADDSNRGCQKPTGCTCLPAQAEEEL